MSDHDEFVPQPPPRFRRFADRYPAVLEAYQKLGEATGAAGPLDARTRRLIRLGIALGARLRGAVHAHTRLALHEGLSADEVRHAAVLAITTLGMPSMMAALDWVEQELDRVSGSE